MAEKLEDLVYNKISRRKMLKNSAFLTLGSVLPYRFFDTFLTGKKLQIDVFFKPIAPS